MSDQKLVDTADNDPDEPGKNDLKTIVKQSPIQWPRLENERT